MVDPIARGRRLRTTTLAMSLAALVAAATVLTSFGADPAYAASRVTVTNSAGGSTADPDYATEVTVSGSGFQSIPKGFGGVYVLFGWVDDPAGGAWRPSNGGVVGQHYRYVPDSESRDNQGFQRFIAFPGSETEASAQAVMSASGDWTVSMVIPSARFESLDRNNVASTVDCRAVQCGIITVGAHGVKNANNETFTPIDFVAPGAESAPEPAPAGTARVGYVPDSAVAGNALVFTGQGFTAGEQVVASLDDGVAAVGPLVAGALGEVAGVLALPSDLRPGTHLLTLTGAASGAVATTEVTVAGGEPGASTVPPAQTEPAWPYLLMALAIVLALILVVYSLVVSTIRRRRARKAAAASRPEPEPEPDTEVMDVATPRELPATDSDAPTDRIPVGESR